MSYLPRQDVGNVVLLEHINLEVDDLDTARLFYSEGLGLVQDPTTLGRQRGGLNVLWFNIGRQQFHICKGTEPQVLGAGSVIGLVLPNLDDIASRLQDVKAELGHLAGAMDCRYSRDNLHVTDPYGNRFVIHSYLPAFPGSHGIAHINLACHVGTSRSVAGFYQEILGAIVVRLDREVAADGSRLLGMQAEGVAVVVGPGMLLIFVEDPTMGELSNEVVESTFSGWHIALYVANFSSVYAKLECLGLILNDHRFKDKCNCLEEALANRQLRFQDILLVEEGEALARSLAALEVRDAQRAEVREARVARGAAAEEARLASSSKASSGGEGDAEVDEDREGGAGGEGADGGCSSGASEEGAEARKVAFRLHHEIRSMHHSQFMKALFNRTY